VYLSNRTLGQLKGEKMKFLADMAHKRRWLVLAIWIFAIVGVGGAAKSAGTAFSSSFQLPDTESSRVQEILSKEFPAQRGDSSQIVFESKEKLTTPENQAIIEKLMTAVANSPIVESVDSPFDPRFAALNPSQNIGFATVHFNSSAQDLEKTEIKQVVEVAKSFESESLQINLSGAVIKLANAVEPSSSEMIAMLAAFLVLLYTFGSLVATLVPIVVAVFALAIGSAFVGLASNFINMADFAPILASLVGLGVGIDYALFIVTRFRRGIHEGKSVQESIRTALTTSGRSVLFAGIIVCISMLGLFTVGLSFLSGVGVAAAISVTVSMIASLTLLPALLSIIGKNIDRLRIPFKKLHSEEEGGNRWKKWADKIQAHPVRWAVSSTLILLFICVPVTQIRLGASDSGNDAVGTTTRQAYDTLAKGFGPGFNGPITMLADVSKQTSEDAANKAIEIIKAQPEVAAVLPAIPTKNGRYQLITVYPKSSPQSEETNNFISELREEIIPEIQSETGVSIQVGGIVAIFKDFGDVLTSKLLNFILTVVILSMLLLMILFRSILIPIKAALMNLLSICAAFGVVVAGFQWGWFEPIFGTSAGPIESFLPIMLFAILFGLSMDYEVFLVSRIHEEWIKSGNSRDSVSKGLAATGSIITAAAAIMIVVFMAFVFLGERTIQLFGVGLAVAVLIDATIIRSTLVPSLMQLAGKWNWYLPSAIEKRLPKVRLEE
jgi:RND superfamily putative drug exporter